MAILAGTVLGAVAVSKAEEAALPLAVTPLQATADSRPFLAAAHQRQPLALGEHGYIEEEFLIRGEARVFEWPDADGPVELARGPYSTRILVRRPEDGERFNGAVIVEALNPSTPVDLPVMWAESYLHFISEGFAWVGVTVKPNVIESLRRFDPDRYGSLGMPNPRPAAACAPDGINAWSQPTTPADETGLAWDLLSQTGALLKSGEPGNPLGAPAERL